MTIPFFASIHVEYDVFQYFLIEVDNGSASIEVLDSFLDRCFLSELDLVNLHLPILMPEGVRVVARVDGRQKEEGKTVYHLTFVGESDRPYPIVVTGAGRERLHLQLNRDLAGLVLSCLKEMFLLKKGMKVYLKHLEVYFSRVIGYDFEKYQEFSSFFFRDALSKTEEKIKWMKAFYRSCAKCSTNKEIIEQLEFYPLSLFTETDLNVDILNVAFQGTSHLPFIIAIKELEDVMLLMFNMVVLVYSHTIGEATMSAESKVETP